MYISRLMKSDISSNINSLERTDSNMNIVTETKSGLHNRKLKYMPKRCGKRACATCKKPQYNGN